MTADHSVNPIYGNSSKLLDVSDNLAEVFFKSLFNNHIWSVIADQTNNYGRNQMHQSDYMPVIYKSVKISKCLLFIFIQ